MSAFALSRPLSAIRVPALRFHPAAAAPSQILRIPIRRRLLPSIRANSNTGPSKKRQSQNAPYKITLGILQVSRARTKISDVLKSSTPDIASRSVLNLYFSQTPTFWNSTDSSILDDLYEVCPKIQAESLRICVQTLKGLRSRFMSWVTEKGMNPPNVERNELISIFTATEAVLAEMEHHLYEAAKKV